MVEETDQAVNKAPTQNQVLGESGIETALGGMGGIFKGRSLWEVILS